jgi:hypothetical protein
MKNVFYLILFFLVIAISSCQTSLYSTRIIDIEIMEPGEVMLPENYNKLAVRYNNCNISHQVSLTEIHNTTDHRDSLQNIDSLASGVYFNNCLQQLKSEGVLSAVSEIEPADYQHTYVNDTLNFNLKNINDSLINTMAESGELYSFILASYLRQNPIKKDTTDNSKYLDRYFGLYSKEEIQSIADSSGADFLLSLDHFSVVDGLFFQPGNTSAYTIVIIKTLWNFYDLQKTSFSYSKERSDTISWFEKAENRKAIIKKMPPRYDAILNAAEISGSRFVEYLLPHWTTVQRMYYYSGQVEFKETEQLVKANKWLEAAKIWKSHVDNPNKNIAAKSMFNLALANEMQGNLNAAIDWVVKSLQLIGQKNPYHRENCMVYTRILGQRKQDIKLIEKQLAGPLQ